MRPCLEMIGAQQAVAEQTSCRAAVSLHGPAPEAGRPDMPTGQQSAGVFVCRADVFCRGSELHCELEGTHRELHQAKTELNKAQQAVTDREHQLALAAAAAEGQVRALAARKAYAGAGAEANLKVSDGDSFDSVPYRLP